MIIHKSLKPKNVTNYMSEEKKEEEDSSAEKIASMHQ